MFVKVNDNTLVNLIGREEIYISASGVQLVFGIGREAYSFETMDKTNKAFDLICEALSQHKKYLDLDKHLK